MINKLAIATFKHRLRDFSVLFAGLVISVAIFLMFSNLANNTEFLNANSSLQMITLIFTLGQFLLGLITFIYLNFANTFLLQLRQREYGLLMMLGANGRQVANLLMQETWLIGGASLIVGMLLGTALTAGAGQVLQSMLHLQLKHFEVVNLHAMVVTIIFFIVLYVLNGLWNRRHLLKTEVSMLLKGDQQAEVSQPNNAKLTVRGVLGVVLIALGFWFMSIVVKIGSTALIAALILNVSGTYLFVSASVTLMLNLIKLTKGAHKGLGSFTMGQLTFRLQSFNRILTIVTLMFALALGAMTIGMGYQRTFTEAADKNSAYTIVLSNPDAKTKQLISELKKVEYIKDYAYQINNGNTVVWQQADLDKNSLPAQIVKGQNVRAVNYTTKQVAAGQPGNQALINVSRAVAIVDDGYTDPKVQVGQLDATKPQEQIILIKTRDMDANDAILAQLLMAQEKTIKRDASYVLGAYGYLNTVRGLMGGLEFMGFFLAIAFLAMLASTLMFKVLSNVPADKKRYNILSMIGATKRQMRGSLAREIGLIFGIPALIGLVDVAVGLQMFKALMANPYIAFGPALLIIFGLYIIYFIFTFKTYWKMLQV
ncbi:MAG: ABC transporter permease [Lactobacillaceae bacterium]|jgi:putative ABC transport system permease protein|nr:ABC transporter permease [Lactobacillaceae bacterium]